MKLDLSMLGSNELKALFQAVKEERERRGRKNPTNHEAPSWVIPKKAVRSETSSRAVD